MQIYIYGEGVVVEKETYGSRFLKSCISLFSKFLAFFERPDLRMKLEGYNDIENKTINGRKYYLYYKAGDETENYRIVKDNNLGSYDIVSEGMYEPLVENDKKFKEHLIERFPQVVDCDQKMKKVMACKDDGCVVVPSEEKPECSDIFKISHDIVTEYLGSVDNNKIMVNIMGRRETNTKILQQKLPNQIFRDHEFNGFMLGKLIRREPVKNEELAQFFPQWYTNDNNKIFVTHVDDELHEIMEKMKSEVSEADRTKYLSILFQQISKGRVVFDDGDEIKIDLEAQMTEKKSSLNELIKSNEALMNKNFLYKCWYGDREKLIESAKEELFLVENILDHSNCIVQKSEIENQNNDFMTDKKGRFHLTNPR